MKSDRLVSLQLIESDGMVTVWAKGNPYALCAFHTHLKIDMLLMPDEAESLCRKTADKLQCPHYGYDHDKTWLFMHVDPIPGVAEPTWPPAKYIYAEM